MMNQFLAFPADCFFFYYEMAGKGFFLVPGTGNNLAGIENGDLAGGEKRFFRMRKRESLPGAK